MDKKEFTSTNETSDKKENVSVDDATNVAEGQTNVTDENIESDNVSEEANEENELEALQKKYNELNDSHLRLMAEFDNYRKRTLREKAELIKNGGESALTNLLPVVDDFERALQNLRTAEDMKAVEEGIELIYTKFMSYLSQQNVKPIETVGKAFDDETSEAVALIPAPDPEMKGKVLDCIQTGYTLNEKVIRHAKVVVGE